jgi:hypothetical protein
LIDKDQMDISVRRRRLLALCVAGVLAVFAVVTAEASSATAEASNQYQSEQQKVDGAIQQALKAGYTQGDLAPITQRRTEIESAPVPFWVGDRPGYFRGQTQALDDLIVQLQKLIKQILDQTRTQAATSMTEVKAQIDRDRQLGVPDTEVNGIQAEYDTVVKQQGAAKTISDYRAVVKAAQQVQDHATSAAKVQQAENDAVQAAATALISKDGGNVDAIRKEGKQALFTARNDASIATYEALPGRFANIVTVNTAYGRLEKWAPSLDSGAVNDVAMGAAAAQRYGDQLHTLVLQGMAPKHIILSFAAQHVWAYQNGSVVMDSLVTTGIRGNTAYGTDFGPMKILWRQHPYKFHSPWPKGSPYWYPDTWVQWTAFFTSSGEAFHDASWQPDSTLGPGSQYQSWTRSHGCVHLPYSLAHWMYDWAAEGTPVDVYPGDGSPVSNQLALMTTDNNGVPLNPA